MSPIRAVSVVILCLPCAAWLAAGNQVRGQNVSDQVPPQVVEFRLSRPLQTPPPPKAALAALRIDQEIWSETRIGLPDVRVLDDREQSVPFVIRPILQTPTTRIRRTWTAGNTELRPQSDGSLEILVRLEQQDAQPEGLNLVTPLRNFELRVQVHAGANRDAPLLTESALLYDYSQYMNVRRTELPLGSSTSREFCIVIDQAVQDSESGIRGLTRTIAGGTETERTESVIRERRPLRIDRLEFWTEVPDQELREAVLVEWPAGDLTIEEDPTARQTIVGFSANRRPLSRVTLRTDSRNFNRMAHLEFAVPGTPEHWQIHNSGELRMLAIGAVNETRLSLMFPAERHSRWRLRIENGDSPSLNVRGLDLAGPESDLVWLAESGRNYRLLYGDDHAEAARHDTQAINKALEAGEPVLVATAGSSTRREVLPREVKYVNRPALLVGLAVLMVVAMSWGLYRAYERIGELPKEPM